MKAVSTEVQQDHSCDLFLLQIANEFPIFLYLLRPNLTSILTLKKVTHLLQPEFSVEGSNRRQFEDAVYRSICVGLQVTCNFTDKSYKYIWEWIETINQEQIALLELTFYSVYWISWYMYFHSGFCKENDAKPKKMECKVGKLCCTCGFTNSNCWTDCSKRCFFFPYYYYFYYLCCGCLGLLKFDPFLFSWQLNKEGMLPFHTFSSSKLVQKKNLFLGFPFTPPLFLSMQKMVLFLQPTHALIPLSLWGPQ